MSSARSARCAFIVAPRAAAEPARPQAIAPVADRADASPATAIENFTELVALAGEKRDLIIKAALEADMRLVRMEDGRLEIALERSAARTLVNDLSRKLEQWTGRRWTVIVSNEAGPADIALPGDAAKNERERAAEADPRVQDVLARFPGAKVVEVRKFARRRRIPMRSTSRPTILQQRWLFRLVPGSEGSKRKGTRWLIFSA